MPSIEHVISRAYVMSSVSRPQKLGLRRAGSGSAPLEDCPHERDAIGRRHHLESGRPLAPPKVRRLHEAVAAIKAVRYYQYGPFQGSKAKAEAEAVDRGGGRWCLFRLLAGVSM